MGMRREDFPQTCGKGAEYSPIRSETAKTPGAIRAHLIKMWLECAVEETDDRGRTTRTTEAKDQRRGISARLSHLTAAG